MVEVGFVHMLKAAYSGNIVHVNIVQDPYMEDYLE